LPFDLTVKVCQRPPLTTHFPTLEVARPVEPGGAFATGAKVSLRGEKLCAEACRLPFVADRLTVLTGERDAELL
jgi:hypothetical protein